MKTFKYAHNEVTISISPRPTICIPIKLAPRLLKYLNKFGIKLDNVGSGGSGNVGNFCQYIIFMLPPYTTAKITNNCVEMWFTNLKKEFQVPVKLIIQKRVS